MNIENVKTGSMVFFAGAFYEVADIKEFPHGKLVGIYDEPPTYHIDYLKPSSLTGTADCYNCQGCGCTSCDGRGIVLAPFS